MPSGKPATGHTRNQASCETGPMQVSRMIKPVNVSGQRTSCRVGLTTDPGWRVPLSAGWADFNCSHRGTGPLGLALRPR